MELMIIDDIYELTLAEQENFIGGKIGHMWLDNGTMMVVRDKPNKIKKNVNEQASFIYNKGAIHHYTIYGNVILVMNEVNNEDK